MEENEDFFVGVYDPVDVRRNLLESSKEVVLSLQLSEGLEEIRKGKLVYLKKMRSVMKELDLLVTKLQERLPDTHLRKSRDRETSKAVVPQKRESSETGIKKTHSPELVMLEKQLREIEKELSELGQNIK